MTWMSDLRTWRALWARPRPRRRRSRKLIVWSDRWLLRLASTWGINSRLPVLWAQMLLLRPLPQPAGQLSEWAPRQRQRAVVVAEVLLMTLLPVLQT